MNEIQFRFRALVITANVYSYVPVDFQFRNIFLSEVNFISLSPSRNSSLKVTTFQADVP